MKRKTPLSHLDDEGRARMVDVSAKPATARQAVATGRITLSRQAIAAIRDLEQPRAEWSARRSARGMKRAGRGAGGPGALKKGDPLSAARLAGVMAAKRTSELIPLCHPLALTHVDVEIAPRRDGYQITATVRTTGPTGVEMEALTAVSVAALTIYDMVKAVDQRMVIGDITLVEKTGGKRDFSRSRAR